MVNLMGIPVRASWLAAFMLSAVFLTGCSGAAAFSSIVEEARVVEAAQITVKEVTNQVELSRSQGAGAPSAQFAPAMVGTDLQPGDGVKTYPNSEARVDITIGDFTRINRTAPNTMWRLGEFAVEGRTIIELQQGKIFLFDNAPQLEGWPVDVVTPAGRASPRGTWMSVAFDPETGVAEVECFRGTCEVQNVHGTQVLGLEQKTVLTAASAPTLPQVLDAKDKLAFIELPEVTNGEITVPPAVEQPAAPALPAVPAGSDAAGFPPADPSGVNASASGNDNDGFEDNNGIAVQIKELAQGDRDTGIGGTVRGIAQGRKEGAQNGRGVNASADKGKPGAGPGNNGKGVNASADKGKPGERPGNNGKGVNASANKGKSDDGPGNIGKGIHGSSSKDKPGDSSGNNGKGVNASADQGKPDDGSGNNGKSVNASANKGKPDDGSGNSGNGVNASADNGKSDSGSGNNGKDASAVLDDDDDGDDDPGTQNDEGAGDSNGSSDSQESNGNGNGSGSTDGNGSGSADDTGSSSTDDNGSSSTDDTGSSNNGNGNGNDKDTGDDKDTGNDKDKDKDK